MRMLRRLGKDESGMTLGLALIMILIIGAMGAGLLTFVSRDLNTVVEANQGQRAFEAADAGIGAAKLQLTSNVDRAKYDGDANGTGTCTDDSQWSALRCTDPKGLTLNDLDEDDTTPDSVNVQISYVAEDEATGTPERFLVVSEGTYGDAKRKIEATFEGVVEDPSGQGDGLGHPVYYTPSDIKITNNDSVNNNAVLLNQISLFSKQNILIQGDTTQAQFITDYNNNSGAFRVSGGNGGVEELCDWKTDVRYQTRCFRSGLGTWNTRARNITTPGLGAEDRICGFTVVSTGTCPSSALSIADGVRGFDRTTGPNDGLTGLPNTNTCDPITGEGQCPRGQMLTFKHKEPLPDGTYPRNDNDGTISYPFPELVPIAQAFKDNANSCYDFNPGTLDCPEPPANSSWGLVSSNSTTDLNRITFIDAGNHTLTFHPGTGAGSTSGIIVVWCGRLLQDDNFEGIILNLIGDDLENGSTCDSNTQTINTDPDGVSRTVGTYVNMGDTTGRNNGTKCACWVYAQGGTDTVAGIEFLPGAEATFRPGARWSFQSSTNFFETPPPTSFAIRTWRELYQ